MDLRLVQWLNQYQHKLTKFNPVKQSVPYDAGHPRESGVFYHMFHVEQL